MPIKQTKNMIIELLQCVGYMCPGVLVKSQGQYRGFLMAHYVQELSSTSLNHNDGILVSNQFLIKNRSGPK